MFETIQVQSSGLPTISKDHSHDFAETRNCGVTLEETCTQKGGYVLQAA